MHLFHRHLQRRCPAYVLWLFMAVVIATGIFACEKEKEPIKLGFSGCLTGRLSDLGTSGRNGVLLAVEQVNAAGGINGRPVKLIVKDDRQEKSQAIRVDQELIDQDVAAIIGHMTSAMSVAAVPVVNREKILMISPTTSTNELSGRDDYFFRVMPPNRAETDHLAQCVYRQMGARTITAACSLINEAYTEGFLNDFSREFDRLGGEMISVEMFESGEATDFSTLAQSLLGPNPDAVLLVAGSLDAAMICQHIRMRHSEIPILSCGWAMTDDFIQHGGPAVEGVVFSQLFDRKSRDKAYVAFKKAFEARFGNPPDFAAGHAYEAARAILRALSENTDPDTLKSTLLAQGSFEGLQGTVTMDRYGDPKRKRHLIWVKGGRFQRKEGPETPPRS